MARTFLKSNGNIDMGAVLRRSWEIAKLQASREYWVKHTPATVFAKFRAELVFVLREARAEKRNRAIIAKATAEQEAAWAAQGPLPVRVETEADRGYSDAWVSFQCSTDGALDYSKAPNRADF
jgi:hypothetical protein